jgi:hypothetical protein
MVRRATAPSGDLVVWTATDVPTALLRLTAPELEPIAASTTVMFLTLSVFNRHMYALVGSGSTARIDALGNRFASHNEAAPTFAPASIMTGSSPERTIASYELCTRCA